MGTTYEKDLGILRLVAAQSIHPRHWLIVRVVAILSWVMPAILIAFIVAFLSVGVSASFSLSLEMPATCFFVLSYSVLWVGIIMAVVVRFKSAVATMSHLLSIWDALVLGLPMLVNLYGHAGEPAPLYMEYINEKRGLGMDKAAIRQLLVQQALESNEQLRHLAGNDFSFNYAQTMSFTIPENEKHLREKFQRLEDYKRN